MKWPALRREQIEEGQLPDIEMINFDIDKNGSQIQKSHGNENRRLLPLKPGRGRHGAPHLIELLWKLTRNTLQKDTCMQHSIM